MLNKKNLSRTLGAAAIAVLFGAPLAQAQSTDTSNTTSAMQSQVSKQDRDYMDDIAHANISEIAAAQLALQKSQNSDVKQFAQKMIDDHTKAEEELKQLADAKGVTLPTEPDVKHKTEAKTLKMMSGKTFDKEYVKHGGVADHEATQKLLQKVEKNAKDQDLKAYAGKTIQAVDEHLAMAKQLEKKVK